MNVFICRIMVVVMTILSFSLSSLQAGQSGHLPSVDIKPAFIAVEELAAEFHVDSNSITVTAVIRNVSHTYLAGYATIYFLSSEGEEIFSYQEEVNEGEPFAHSSTVSFESTAQVADVDKIGSISVDFTQK